MINVKRALLSVYKKDGIVELAQNLENYGVEIISTGGTLKLLKDNGIKVKSVTELTGFPEILDGRVKTLNPLIHGGILYKRKNRKHSGEVKAHGISGIDLVVVNLYPFREVISKKSVTLDEALENIDIGGPTMIRAAAKNFKDVAVVIDPNNYSELLAEIEKNKGCVSYDFAKRMAVKVFTETASYDVAISSYLSEILKEDKGDKIIMEYNLSQNLRYGENPHQKGAFYSKGCRNFAIEKLQGKEISYNNIMDIYSAVEIINEFREPAAAVIKHSNPCGVAVNVDILKAIRKAVESDRLSAFGGIVVLNRPVGGPEIKLIFGMLGFFEVLIAPSFSKKALEMAASRKNLRLIKIKDILRFLNSEKVHYRYVPGGLLVQDADKSLKNSVSGLKKKVKIVTEKKISEKMLDELLFAWRVVKNVKSNAIVVSKNMATVGIGAGQMSRVDSMIIACRKAGDRSVGGVVASDAFFPKADNIDVAHKAGIRAIIQPGGSIRDGEVIEAANKYRIAMVFTGKRHFKH